METATMGCVLVNAKVENFGDLYAVEQGTLIAEQVRTAEIVDAWVDTGAITLSLPKRLIDQLGLKLIRTRPARTSAGTIMAKVYGAVRLTIMGRDMPCDVIEVPDECPALIGQLVLEGLDFVIDVPNHRLTGNPAHGGEQIIELY